MGGAGRLERAGHLVSAPDPSDRRSRLIQMTDNGREVWRNFALPKIRDYYDLALKNFSTNDIVHTVHYLLKILNNMQALDVGGDSEGDIDSPED